MAAARLSALKTSDGKKGYGISSGCRGWTELLTVVWQNGGNAPSNRQSQDSLRR